MYFLVGKCYSFTTPLLLSFAIFSSTNKRQCTFEILYFYIELHCGTVSLFVTDVKIRPILEKAVLSHLLCLSAICRLRQTSPQEKTQCSVFSAIGRVNSHNYASCIFKTTGDERQRESNEVTLARQRLCTELFHRQKIRRANVENGMGKALCVN